MERTWEFARSSAVKAAQRPADTDAGKYEKGDRVPGRERCIGLLKEMKNKTQEVLVQELCQSILREIGHWNYINKFGCNDPFWPDGTNMNLTRNHVISYKQQIKELCEENHLDLPEEYYLSTPPEVDDDYMANRKQKKRVKRLRQQGVEIKKGKYDFDAMQIRIEDFTKVMEKNE